MKRLFNHDPENACYSGYILKSLADIKRNLDDIRTYNQYTDFMDEESRLQTARIYEAILGLLEKSMDTAERFGAIISPEDRLDEDFKTKYATVKGE